MSLIQKLKNSPSAKAFILFLLFRPHQARPRAYVQWLINPFFHHRGKNSRIGAYTRMDVIPFNGFSLGHHSVIEDFSVINNGVGEVTIGDRVLIGLSNVIIGPVSIGHDVILAQHVVLSGLNHEYENIAQPIASQKVKTRLITVEDEAWIGANAVITAGVRIGRHSVVAGGSVVTRNVEDYTVVGGNPARVLKVYNPANGDWERV